MTKVQIAVPTIGDEEYQAVKDTLMSGWLTQGPKVKAFEASFCDYHQLNHALAVTSCTTGLQLILSVLGVGEGDEVIVPAFTWVATANVVVHAGATPIFVDIDLMTFNIDPNKIKDKITSKTKAIIAVHMFGLCADMEAIKKVSGAIPIIEDAACAVAARSPKGFAGALGMAASFSFHPRKTITTGEGGMVTTNSKELAEKMDVLRNHGASISEEQRHNGPRPYILPDFDVCGFNFRMTDIQACIGIEQMKRLSGLIIERQVRSRWYSQQLLNVEWLQTPNVPEGYDHGWQSYVCLVNKEKGHEFRNHLMDVLQSKGISTRPGTHAVHMLNFYKNRFGLEDNSFEQAKKADQLSIALPLHSHVSDDQYQYIVQCIKEFEFCVA